MNDVFTPKYLGEWVEGRRRVVMIQWVTELGSARVTALSRLLEAAETGSRQASLVLQQRESELRVDGHRTRETSFGTSAACDG